MRLDLPPRGQLPGGPQPGPLDPAPAPLGLCGVASALLVIRETARHGYLLVGYGLERLAVLLPLWWNVSDSLPGGLDAVLRFQREVEGCRLPSFESKVFGSREAMFLVRWG
jgi:hypothetical protein